MIKTNELRIGSLFHSQKMNGNGIIMDETTFMWKVVGISPISVKGCMYKLPFIEGREYTEFDADVISPIALTTEIFERAGFEKCSCGGWRGKAFKLHLDIDLTYYPAKEPLKYLHQLQNLHFVLTDLELEMK